MLRRAILVLAIVGLGLSIWPAARSLADLTGEEALPGQVRGVAHWLNTVIRPNPQLAPHAAITHTDVSPFGMNVFLEQEPDPAVRDESARLAQVAGFRFLRQQFSWEDIEIHAKGDFSDRRNVEAVGVVNAWDKYDQIVAVAAKYGLQIIARLDNPPAWSRAVGNGPDNLDSHGPPDNFADYGDFVAATVGRYAGQITYFQLWNEPNIFPEWGNRPPDPEKFTELACLAYRRAKAANPNAVILAAALAPTVDFSDRNMNDLIFLDRAYRAGYGACFDIFSAQGYGFWSGPADQRLRPTVINYPHHLLLRDMLVLHGDADKAIWISEVGWNSPAAGVGEFFGRTTEEQRARYAVQLYQRARQEWPWVGVVNYWFLKRATDAEKDQPFYYFRLMEPDFTPYPAYTALSAYANGPQPTPGVKVLANWRRPLMLVALTALFFTVLISLPPDSAETAP